MVCPRCGGATVVLDSRPVQGGAALYRRRRCDECGHRFSTAEAADERADETRLVLAAIRREVNRLDALLGPPPRARNRRGG